MQVHSDRFETVLPKTERFFAPSRPKQQQKPPVWGYLAAGVLIGATLLGAMMPRNPASTSPLPNSVGTNPPPVPLPEVRTAEPVHEQVSSPPRAQLVHIRTIGTFENERMPDGRVLSTTYRGELSSAAQLPRTGGQPGDMWYTRHDGHCWVLAPIYAGSQTTGWVDP